MRGRKQLSTQPKDTNTTYLQKWDIQKVHTYHNGEHLVDEFIVPTRKKTLMVEVLLCLEVTTALINYIV